MDAPQKSYSRREFLGIAAHSLAILSLLQLSLVRRVIAAGATRDIVKWINEANELARCVRAHQISPVEWQRSMEHLLARIDLPLFLKLIDFDELSAKAHLPDSGESFQDFSFKHEEGMPEQVVFYRNFAGFRKGRSIPPHGHHNLASSFLVLKGELRGRHFERLSEDGAFFLIKPTIDKSFKAGNFSTVSDDKDNVHWFTALTDGAFIFDFGVGHINPKWKPMNLTKEQEAKWRADSASGMDSKSDRVYLDLNKKERISAEEYRVPRISHEDAYKLFG
jgi:hypothetical protein